MNLYLKAGLATLALILGGAGFFYLEYLAIQHDLLWLFLSPVGLLGLGIIFGMFCSIFETD